MRYRKLDANGDYTFGTGADFHANTPETVGQAISTRLKLWKEEWFLDKSDGTDYRGQVLGKRSGRSPDVEIKRRILGTPGVTALTAFSMAYDGDTRALPLTATVQTLYGDAQISEVF